MSRRSDAEKMVRQEARRHGFLVEKAGQEWRVTNPATGAHHGVPERLAGRDLLNERGKVRRLAERTPMQAAVAADPGRERRPGDNWAIQELIAAAYRAGVIFDLVHGQLHINAHMDNRSWVDVLRRREAEVIAFLDALAREQYPDPGPEPDLVPETPQGADESMPKIGDVARIEGPSRKENLAVDAKALYDLLREQAAKQGDERGTNARAEGVLWTGTLTSVLRAVGYDWDAAYQEEVSRYLRDTQHIRCQRRGNPSIWWIRDTWNDGSLTVTRTPTPADVPQRTTAALAPASKPSPAAETPPPGDEYTQLMKLLEAGRTAAATIDELEIEIAGLKREVEEKNGMLLSVRAELRADVEALQAENRQLRQELAQLENIKALATALKGAL